MPCQHLSSLVISLSLDCDCVNLSPRGSSSVLNIVPIIVLLDLALFVALLWGSLALLRSWCRTVLVVLIHSASGLGTAVVGADSRGRDTRSLQDALVALGALPVLAYRKACEMQRRNGW